MKIIVSSPPPEHQDFVTEVYKNAGLPIDQFARYIGYPDLHKQKGTDEDLQYFERELDRVAETVNPTDLLFINAEGYGTREKINHDLLDTVEGLVGMARRRFPDHQITHYGNPYSSDYTPFMRTPELFNADEMHRRGVLDAMSVSLYYSRPSSVPVHAAHSPARARLETTYRMFSTVSHLKRLVGSPRIIKKVVDGKFVETILPGVPVYAFIQPRTRLAGSELYDMKDMDDDTIHDMIKPIYLAGADGIVIWQDFISVEEYTRLNSRFARIAAAAIEEVRIR